MAAVFDIDGAAGVFAMYDEPPSGSSDAPLYNPMAHLSRIKIHSGLEYLQVATEFDVTVAHPFVAKPTTGWDWSSWSFNWYPTTYTVDRLLGTHNLGVVPFCVVATAGGVVEPGVPVQINTAGGLRYVHIYLTATEVRCVETVDSANADLPAINITYKIMVLREGASLGNGVMFDANSGRVTAGEGWFDSDYHYLRAVASGESPYYIVGSQNIDTTGGICRTIDALGNIRHDFFQVSDYTGSLSSVVTQQVQR